MEPSLWITVANALGFQVTVAAIVFNWGDWKANLLFFVSFAFLCVRLYFYVRRKGQEVRREDFEYRRDKWEEKQEKSRHPDDRNDIY